MITRIGNEDHDVSSALAELIDARAKQVFNLMYAEHISNPPLIIPEEWQMYCPKCGTRKKCR